jgi:GDPmannose 4,6-dehydratase
MQKTAIITGITGQDGAYLSQLLLEKGYRVIGCTRPDAEKNYSGLHYLKIQDKILFKECNLLHPDDLVALFEEFEPLEVYNLAAQSSVRLSFEKPLETIQVNILSVANLLEAVKKVDKRIRFYQASSSDMFGNIENLPVTEQTIIHPTSPYGISKATGHWMTVNYRESYGLFACCGILFNHESYLRGPDFFVKKIIRSALEIQNGKQQELRVGDISLRRDFGYAPDYVKAMWLMLQQDVPKDYLVCSGESLVLQEIIYYVFGKLRISTDRIVTDSSFFRPNDISNIYGTNEKAKHELGWNYDKTFFDVLDILIQEELENYRL